MNPDPKYFIPAQIKWIKDDSPLKIIEKSRQVGVTHATDYRTVSLVSAPGARFDAFISTRDNIQAKLTLENCKQWAKLLHLGAMDLGEVVFAPEDNSSAYALEFANRRRIYALSSNPNCLAGKSGHVILDEFALHKDQRLLWRVAKPVTTWGGTMTIISTHRGTTTLFYDFIVTATQRGNPMGFSHHKITIYKAVRQGIVARINKKSGRNESRLGFIRRLRAECRDRETWLQEYCCVPADESAAFITYDMLNACEQSGLSLMSPGDLQQHCAQHPGCSLYIGVDVARFQNLCVIDVGEKIGDVMWDRLRLDLHNRPFSEIEQTLFPLLALPQVKRACIDASTIGIHLTERAKQRFGYKVEGITFNPQVKEALAFPLRAAFEDRSLRIVAEDKLREDLRALRKETTPTGNIRLDGNSADSHCDRFWAKALRHEAARTRAEEPWALLC